ncbi:hypothetical protein MCP_1589 [Methanocella paludicola SANAE]|uniref:Uncharacterized protein n=1 Tax=Methanocella paludicola (strain DSM 17711 / JCM 13418 / NBRC 101707 / SANAE) TaxID=304371 RepID=D1YYY9_METPS|nr:hypothetical protein [Methanocella paludicola]BAI61661.1 hypothetical protein MCP_1589 [Methanocella paludicola SANAE]
MVYSDPEKQREACREAMKRYRERVKAGQPIKERPSFMTTTAIVARVHRLELQENAYIEERKNYPYNTKAYRNLTSYISVVRRRIIRWKNILSTQDIVDSASTGDPVIDEAIARIDYLYRSLVKKQAIRDGLTPDARLYMSYTSEICRIRKAIERWQRVIDQGQGNTA